MKPCPLKIDLAGFLAFNLFEIMEEDGWTFHYVESISEVHLLPLREKVEFPNISPLPEGEVHQLQLRKIADLEGFFPQKKGIIHTTFLDLAATSFKKAGKPFPLKKIPQSEPEK